MPALFRFVEGRGECSAKLQEAVRVFAYNMGKHIAAEGSGHDPKWRAKSYF